MPLYYFCLRAHGKLHRDGYGTDLRDIAAARAHASAVADELMCNSAVSTRHWSMYVEDASGERLFELFFAEIDSRLASYSPRMRILAQETCRRLAAHNDALAALRATEIESRILMARSRGKPHLVYTRGQ